MGSSGSSGAILTGKRKKNQRGTLRYREKRRAQAAGHDSSREVKPTSASHAQNASPLFLSSFDAASFPVASTGWSGSASKKATLAGSQEHWQDREKLLNDPSFRYINWDGE